MCTGPQSGCLGWSFSEALGVSKRNHAPVYVSPLPDLPDLSFYDFPGVFANARHVEDRAPTPPTFLQALGASDIPSRIRKTSASAMKAEDSRTTHTQRWRAVSSQHGDFRLYWLHIAVPGLAGYSYDDIARQ
jgi:hypothetical protein